MFCNGELWVLDITGSVLDGIMGHAGEILIADHCWGERIG
jgi:hypothetical protein